MGGGAFTTPRHVFWNFVSSSRDRLNQAKEDWKAQRFPLIPGDDQEFIPVPRGGPDGQLPVRGDDEAVPARLSQHGYVLAVHDLHREAGLLPRAARHRDSSARIRTIGAA